MKTRRRFLKVLSASALVSAVPACGDETGSSGGQVLGSGKALVDSSIHPVAANASDLMMGDLGGDAALEVLVGVDEGGIYAMTAICTHAQCNLVEKGEVIDSGLILFCSCHSSQFFIDGTVDKGPAAAPLDHLLVEVDKAGNVHVDVNTVVPIDERSQYPAA